MTTNAFSGINDYSKRFIVRECKTSTGLDLLPFVSGIRTTESISDFGMTYQVDITEPHNYPSTPRVLDVGTEVSIIIDSFDSTGDITKSKTVIDKTAELFSITIEPNESLTEKFHQYRLQLRSSIHKKNVTDKLHTTVGVSTVISTLKKHYPELVSEYFKPQKEIVIPNVPILEFVRYAASVAVSANGDNCSFRFYENNDGLYFRPLESLKRGVQNNGTLHSFVLTDSDSVGGGGGYKWNTINSITSPELPSIGVMKSAGMFGNTHSDVNLHTGKRKDYTFKFSDYKQKPMNSTYPSVDAKYISLDALHSVDYVDNETRQYNPDDFYAHPILLHRVGEGVMNMFGLTIETIGTHVSAGDVIQLDIPRGGVNAVYSNDNTPDYNLSGRWLVESVDREFSGVYTHTLVLKTDSLTLE